MTVLKERFRLSGIDTPEIRTKDKEEKKRGMEAKKFLDKIFVSNKNQILIHSEKTGSFRRWLAVVYPGWWDVEKKSVNQMLLDEGLAEVYKK